MGIQRYQTIQDQRDRQEKRRFDFCIERVIPKCKLKDDLFAEFTEFFADIRSSVKNDDALEQIKELWRFWLDQIDHRFTSARAYNILTEDDVKIVKSEFEQFKKDINTSKDTFDLYKNGSYLVRLVAPTIKTAPKINPNSASETEAAIKALSKAIELDEKFAYAAYYYRAMARFQLGHIFFDKTYQQEALEDFKKAAETIVTLTNILDCQLNNDVAYARNVEKETNWKGRSNYLQSQLNDRKCFFGILMKHIQAAIQKINCCDDGYLTSKLWFSNYKKRNPRVPGFFGFPEAINPGTRKSCRRDRYQSTPLIKKKQLIYHTP
ncbi:hypothetical protein Ddc_22182 [Ditylenchus destructor]|nr:hypothetical protein Ddc_22182 [Ditylenchus destructor]